MAPLVDVYLFLVCLIFDHLKNRITFQLPFDKIFHTHHLEFLPTNQGGNTIEGTGQPIWEDGWLFVVAY
jgi:hypothetical protein